MPATTRTYRLLVLLFILCVIFVGGDYFIRFHIILPEFAELERQEAIKDITRATSSIGREYRHIDKVAGDWAVWDDMYQYVIDGNAPFAASNFQWDSLLVTGIHLIYVINADGNIVYSGTILPSTGEMIKLQQLPVERFPNNHYLLKIVDNANSFPGVFLTEKGPMLLASRKILTSTGEGPSRGTLLFGRFLDNQAIKEIQEQTQVQFTVRNPLSAPFLKAEQEVIEGLETGKQIIKIANDNTLLISAILNDLQEQPALLITASLSRAIMARGRDTARLSSLTVLLAMGLIIFAGFTLTLVLIQKSKRQHEEVEALVKLRTDQLQLSEERLDALSDASFEAIFLTEAGVCLEQNNAAEAMFGYCSEEAVGSRSSMWIAHEDRKLVNRKAREKNDLPYEIKALRKDGQVFPAEIQTREAEYRGRKILVSSLRDLSLQKKAEEVRQLMEDKLRRAQKMESIGIMAGGVAHDLNNILSGVITYPELILLSLPEDSPLVTPIKAIRESGKSAAAVVDDLLTLARGVSSSRVSSNINVILAEYTDSTEFHNLQSLHGNVTFRIKPDPLLLNINCSPIHIKKCIMNLMINAAEAIGDKGEVVISTRNEYYHAPLIGYPEMRQGEYSVLSVADNGTGIPDESLERIFEPFFSRKVVGRSGTGLGLVVIWNTVQDHQGGIIVKSGKDGTTFELCFPATREDLKSLPDTIEIEEYQGKGEKILVVDDDNGQRSIAAQILARLNYTVHAVESGEEALLYLSREKADLVILDMIMAPGMNGCQTFRKILELHPQQKAIITSGYSESQDVKEALDIGVREFVKKPYLIGTLATIILDTLQNR